MILSTMEDDWSEVSDAVVRKRIQNRLAQRKHRQKAQTQAQAQAQGNKSTEKAVAAPRHPQLVSPTNSLFLPSISTMEPRASADGMSGDIWANDFTHNASILTAQGACVGTTWNLSTGENGNGGEILDRNWGEDVHRGLSKAQPSRKNRTSGILVEEGEGRMTNQQQHTGSQSMPTDIDAILPRMMMYPETSHWMPDSPCDNSFTNTPAPRNRTEPDITHERDASTDGKEHCDKCDHRRQRNSHENASVSYAYRGSSNISSRRGSLPASSSIPADPISPASTTPTLSRLMRDHDIELDHLISQASLPMRDSIGVASMAGGGGGGARTSHGRHLKRRYSDANTGTSAIAATSSRVRSPPLPPLPDVPEKNYYDLVEQHEYAQSQDSEDTSEPKVTKIVVIYMQERQR
ncbi:hypothetical protein F5Y12DRAFT_744754 [Xylaria sp. FL1777]|nr:hypothetical protein F5Y12DRAFT_744754 [Xylaria sp. FL1777]